MSTEESQSGSYGEEPPSFLSSPVAFFMREVSARFRVVIRSRLSSIEILVP